MRIGREEMNRYDSIISDADILIPGLPNDVASLILSFVPFSYHSIVKATCKSWYAFFSLETLISLRRKHKKLSHLLCFFPEDPSISTPYLFDPENFAWRLLPHMPCNPYTYGLSNFVPLSLGHHLYILGGSVFDARSFPLDRPLPSSSVFRFNFVKCNWESLAPMLHPRGSFACAADPNSEQIIVAGGGSRHSMFVAAGSRIGSVERYDVQRNDWVAMEELPRFRAGCVGFFARNGAEKEFWVIGGYGESRTLSGVFPVDEHYRDAVVMKFGENGDVKWREVGDLWGEEERTPVGKIVVTEDENGSVSGVFMLDETDIFRFDMSSNRWLMEVTVPKKSQDNKPFGFVAVGGELHVMTLVQGIDFGETRWKRRQRRVGALFTQIYDPRTKTWKQHLAKPPFSHPLDFNTAILCSIKL